MSLINRQIAALFDGVSQQPAPLRLPSQGEEQVNAWDTVVKGKQKRPPTQHVAKVAGVDFSSAHVHVINRDTTERYIVIVLDGDLQVFDLAGNQKTVSFPYGKGYLKYQGIDAQPWVASMQPKAGTFVRPTAANGYVYKAALVTAAAAATEPVWPTTPGQTIGSGGITFVCYVDPGAVALNPQTDMGATTIADYTFIVNKSVIVQMLPQAADQYAQDSGYWWLNNPSSALSWYGQAYITAAQQQYTSNPSGGILRGTVQSFENLPGVDLTNKTVPNQGDIYQVQGDQNSAFTSYYVIYRGGVWNETVAPDIQNSIDPHSMPWALVRQADGTFQFAPFSWAPRRVGDETTNPNPSFVGRSIRDIYFEQNRFGLLSDENAIESAAGDFGNFYRLTVVQLLPDSVVDIGASETKVTKLNFAVPFSTGLMFFSDQTQFRRMTPTDGLVTPTTVSLKVATNFLASTTVRPIMLGSDVYFVSEDADYAHIREYFVTLNYLSQFQTDADDTTGHVPSLIPKGVYMLAGSLVHDALFVATSAYPNRAYVYKFHWQDEQHKVQSSWGYWDFGTGNKVLAAAGLDDFVYWVIQRPDGVCIEKMSLAIGANVGIADSNGNLFDILLDRRCTVAGVYLSGEDKTIFNLPYDYVQSRIQMVAADGATPGAWLPSDSFEYFSANQIKVAGNKAGNYLAGEFYVLTYKFSEQFMRNQDGAAILGGSLTLGEFSIYFVDTAFFELVVDPYGNGAAASAFTFLPAEESSYEAWTIGESTLITGTPIFKTGKVTFGVFGASNEATILITNDTPYPCTFQSAEWEGNFVQRSRTV